jgi:hypothetical protein
MLEGNCGPKCMVKKKKVALKRLEENCLKFIDLGHTGKILIFTCDPRGDR